MTTVKEAIEYLQNNFDQDEEIFHIMLPKGDADTCIEHYDLDSLTDEQWSKIVKDESFLDSMLGAIFDNFGQDIIDYLEEQEEEEEE